MSTLADPKRLVESYFEAIAASDLERVAALLASGAQMPWLERSDGD